MFAIEDAHIIDENGSGLCTGRIACKEQKE
jgi:hypothetical protein